MARAAMTKALVTFGTGGAAELLDIALPAFREYAQQHGYDLLVADDIPTDRPPAWYKIPAILEALRTHDEVLWLDADVLILDASEDLADEVGVDAWQALAFHHTPDGEVPNTGVWFARRPMVPVLDRMWRIVGFMNHPWWEQGAVCQLLGYNPWERPMARKTDTELFARTQVLGLEWNSHRDDEHPDPRFWHATVRGDRALLMRQMLERATA